MNLEKRLEEYKTSMKIVPKEQNIEETVRKSIEVYCSAEEDRLLTYREFLWVQLRLMRKRWWFFQIVLLLVLWSVLPSLQGELYAQRFMGVAASLFIIFIIPEFWKSQSCQSMEIEAASYYSLRQIYSARMLLFGIVDTVLISAFGWLSLFMLNVTLSQILIQFILPMTVTAGICFGMLCSKHSFNEAAAIMMCIGWSSVWLFIVLNEKIYAAIAYPVWIMFLGIALLFTGFTIYRTLYFYNDYWEENYGVDIG